jgi:VanZ family protein
MIPDVLSFSDKLKHFGAYSVLAFLLYFALSLQKKYDALSNYALFFTILITAFYGLFDEIHQIYIPGRYFDWWDLLADVVGGIIGILIAKYIVFFYQKKNSVISEHISS